MSAWVLAALASTAILYAAAAGRSPGWLRRRTLFACAGLLGLVLAEPLSEGSLATDMVGHGVIVAVAVPLLVLARPVALLHRHLRPELRARMRELELPVGRRLEPWLLWAVFVGLQWWFHLGPAADAAQGEGGWHGLEHGLFVLSALGFWSAVLVPAPGMRRMGDAERAGYLLAAMPALDLIGAIWIAQGMTAAGVAMIASMLPLGVAFVAVAARGLIREERQARRLEVPLAREPTGQHGALEAGRG